MLTIPQPKILIVDDDPYSRIAISSVLEPLDLELIGADCGEQALRDILAQEFALIILDVRLPGMSGFETARAIRERELSRDLPIIFLTGVETDEIQINRGYDLGAIDYMFKPIVPEILRAKVKHHVKLLELLEAEKVRKAMEQEREQAHAAALEQLVTELERSNRELDDFAYIASHDLKEPLRGIAINADLLNEENLTTKGKQRVKRLKSLSVRMEKLITDLLNYSKLGRGQRVFKDIDTRNLVDEIGGDLNEWMVEQNATIEIDGELPCVFAERSKVKTIFQNLIVNGFKYNRSPAKTIHIGFDINEGGNGAFYVRDNGIGIDPEHHERVFRIFSRLHGDDVFEPGSGAGLSFVRKIIEDYSQGISISSELGEGSTFWFSLPLSQVKGPIKFVQGVKDD